MTDAEATVVVESVVSEENEVSLSVTETNQETPEIVEEGAPAVADEAEETRGSPVLKRKLENLEHSENDEAPSKKLEICGPEPSLEDSGHTEDGAIDASKSVTQESVDQLENDDSGHPTTEKPVTESDAVPGSSAVDENVEDAQKGQDLGTDGAALFQDKTEAESLDNGQISSSCMQHASLDDGKDSFSVPQLDGLPLAGEQSSLDHTTSSRKIEIPNNKVGVLIGKSGETIRYLQINSGAKIQITRDADSNPDSSTRPVELIGSLENITKAEQLIKDVIAEADAGGSPALIARGFSTPHSGGEQSEIQVPNEKVGMIIGKGGETIKGLQTKTGARIQLLPQHLPERDSSKVRTIRITGNKKQVESAKEMIKDVMNQIPMRPSSMSSSYGHQGFRAPRGPSPVNQWGPPRASSTHSQQTMGYDHQQRGIMYPPQTAPYPQHYGGFSQQPLPRGGSFGSSWEQQRPTTAAPLHAAAAGPQPGGHDYYHHGGPAAPNNQPSNMFPGPLSTSTPAALNYNYGQSQGAADSYGHAAPYSQQPPSQQSYGHGYNNEPKYESQPQSQPIYGQQQPISSQPGVYGPQSAAPYGKPAYGNPSHEVHPSYAPPPRGGQPGEQMYQGSTPNQYPSNVPMQQPYPSYGSSAPAHQAPPPYGQGLYGGPPSADGYSQQLSAGYAQHGGQPGSGYGQVPSSYSQPVSQSGQYPPSQPTSYTDQTAQMNPNYGYQDAGYAPSAGYVAPQSGGAQPGYAQPATNSSGYYDQSVPAQSGYGGAPTTATAGYAKSVSPQPGYGQYDSSQMYGHH